MRRSNFKWEFMLNLPLQNGLCTASIMCDFFFFNNENVSILKQNIMTIAMVMGAFHFWHMIF